MRAMATDTSLSDAIQRFEVHVNLGPEERFNGMPVEIRRNVDTENIEPNQ